MWLPNWKPKMPSNGNTLNLNSVLSIITLPLLKESPIVKSITKISSNLSKYDGFQSKFFLWKCGRYDEGKVKYVGKHLLHNFAPIVKYPRSWLTAKNCHNFALFHHWRGAHTKQVWDQNWNKNVAAHFHLTWLHTVTFHSIASLFTLSQPNRNWVRLSIWWVSRHLNPCACTFSTPSPWRKILDLLKGPFIHVWRQGVLRFSEIRYFCIVSASKRQFSPIFVWVHI